MMDRIKHLPTTSFGLGVGGVVAYAFTQLGCQTPNNWMTFGIGLIAALPGILAKK